MAAVGKLANGFKMLTWYRADGKRTSMRLGKMSLATANQIKIHVDAIIAAQRAGTTLPVVTAQWLRDIDDDFHTKLARNGFCRPRKPRGATSLADVLNAYMDRRNDVSASTQDNYRSAANNLLEYFAQDLDVREITMGDARDWQRWLTTDKEYAEATSAKHVKVAKQVFNDLVEREVIDRSPFRKLKAGKMTNEARQEYITTETIDTVIDACRNPEWKLILSLCRYGGLRCPSEILVLTWTDVLWDERKLFIDSPKTGPRFIPMFPEIEPHLSTLFDLAEPGTKHVITQYRKRNANLRTQLGKIIARAGVKPWGKPFQNLRSSCQTDLTARFPAHVVCAWLGNSRIVAQDHYLQVTDADFERAATKTLQTIDGQRQAV